MIKRMETPKTSLASRSGLLNGYGLGNEFVFRNKFQWRGHNGAGFGFYSDLWYNHDLDIGYVVLVNQFDSQSVNYVRKLRELIAEYLTENTQINYQPIISISKEQLNEYSGTYTIEYGGKDPLSLINYLHAMIKINIAGDTAGDTVLSVQPFAGDERNIFPISNNLFREHELPDAMIAFFNNADGKKSMVKGRDYFEETSPWKIWGSLIFIIWSLIIIFFVLIWVIIKLIVSVYSRISKIKTIKYFNKYNVFPFLASILLIVAILLISNQEMYYLGKRTFASFSLCISTWIFGIFSLAGFVITILNIQNIRRITTKISYLIIHLTFLSFTIYMWYWGFLGLKLWI
jgi:hypothetical protein